MMYVAFDRATGEPQIVRHVTEDGESRVALVASGSPDAVRDVIAKLYGKTWIERFEYRKANASGIATRRGVLWFFDGGPACRPVLQA